MPVPNYDLGILITLNICLTLIGMSIAVAGVWFLSRDMKEIMASNERIANICERIDARLRRSFPNIGDDLL